MHLLSDGDDILVPGRSSPSPVRRTQAADRPVLTPVIRAVGLIAGLLLTWMLICTR